MKKSNAITRAIDKLRNTGAEPADIEKAVDESIAEAGAIIDRQATHGIFTDHARVSQALKDILREQLGWDKLAPDMRESLDMQVHKMARIVTGNPHVVDHWADIAGYASRVSERLIQEERSARELSDTR